MAVYYINNKVKIMCGSNKIKKGFYMQNKIYSSGNIVTYYVDTNIVYTEERDEGESVLSPATFVPALTGWEFLGWRTDKSTASYVLDSLNMGDDPITLYAVFYQPVTVTYYNDSTTAMTASSRRIYNNGNIHNPSFST